jgi:hypothetical protein
VSSYPALEKMEELKKEMTARGQSLVLGEARRTYY